MNQAISEHISRILLITYSLWYFMTKAIPLNIRLIYLKKYDKDQFHSLEKRLPDFGLPKNHCFHVGPIIRREEDYISFSIKERRKILNSLITFFNNVEISYKTFYVEKNHLYPLKMTALLSKKLFLFLYERAEYFSRFDRIVVYYDNGQVELGKLLATVFAIALPGAEFRRVIPADYRLFQVADLICTMQLTMLKDGRHILSNSEEIFFGSLRDMKKNYLKPILKKQIPD